MYNCLVLTETCTCSIGNRTEASAGWTSICHRSSEFKRKTHLYQCLDRLTVLTFVVVCLIFLASSEQIHYTVFAVLRISQLTLLTVCHPSMFAVFTLPPLQLPRLEAVTVTVHQSAADCLLKKKQSKS